MQYGVKKLLEECAGMTHQCVKNLKLLYLIVLVNVVLPFALMCIYPFKAFYWEE